MSSLTGVAKYYDVLTHRERLTLVLAALAREDEVELQRLRLSCPRKVYSQLDDDFLGLLTGTETIADKFLLMWLTASRSAYCAEAVMAITRRRLVEAAKTDPAADDEIDLQVGILFTTLSHWGGVLAGYRKFCEQVEIDPDQVLAAWYPPIRGEIPALEEKLADLRVEPDEETTEGIVSMLSSWWPPLRGGA